MPIKRCSQQTKISLEEYYIEFTKPLDIAPIMIPFLKIINDTFIETQLWGLTSHARLVILTEDSSLSQWYIIVVNIGSDDYYFEYLMPEHKQPFTNATVRGEAKSLAEAKKYLLIAMKECEGWKGNIELERLLMENGLE